MALKPTIENDMKEALRAKESTKLGTLRMLISDIKKREIDKRTALDDSEIQKAIQTMIKQRNESVEAFIKGQRPDLAEKEKEEIQYLKIYLPATLSDSELAVLVDSAIAESNAKTAKDIGQAMKLALSKAAGRADGKTINELIRKKLQA